MAPRDFTLNRPAVWPEKEKEVLEIHSHEVVRTLVRTRQFLQDVAKLQKKQRRKAREQCLRAREQHVEHLQNDDKRRMLFYGSIDEELLQRHLRLEMTQGDLLVVRLHRRVVQIRFGETGHLDRDVPPDSCHLQQAQPHHQKFLQHWLQEKRTTMGNVIDLHFHLWRNRQQLIFHDVRDLHAVLSMKWSHIRYLRHLRLQQKHDRELLLMGNVNKAGVDFHRFLSTDDKRIRTELWFKEHTFLLECCVSIQTFKNWMQRLLDEMLQILNKKVDNYRQTFCREQAFVQKNLAGQLQEKFEQDANKLVKEMNDEYKKQFDFLVLDIDRFKGEVQNLHERLLDCVTHGFPIPWQVAQSGSLHLQ